jgi:hypothetical protein
MAKRMPQIGKKRERRRYSRTPIDKAVPVLWEDERGHETHLQAQLIDVSVSGARILLPIRLPPRSVVSFNCLTLAVGGRGTVRYCNAAKGGYVVGLELSNGTGWRDQNTDLQNLAAAIDRSSPAIHPSKAQRSGGRPSDALPETPSFAPKKQ